MNITYNDPLPTEITNEIRTILEECRDGIRYHNQIDYTTEYQCGTAHCIAGWKVADDIQRYGRKLPVEEGEIISNTWNYAQYHWGLSCLEAEILFPSYATFDEQFELLETLESGGRVNDL